MNKIVVHLTAAFSKRHKLANTRRHEACLFIISVVFPNADRIAKNCTYYLADQLITIPVAIVIFKGYNSTLLKVF